MSALAVRPDHLTLSDAVDAVVARALDGEMVAHAAAGLVDRLDYDDMRTAAVRGLAALVHDRLAVLRVPREEDADPGSVRERRDGTPPVRSRHYAAELWRRRLEANYEAADGTRKPLSAFTPPDVAHLFTLADTRADGYRRLADAMALAGRLLAEHKRAAIRLLPVAAQREIAEALT